MKWSQFNYLFHSEKIGYCLHNTRMLSLISLDKESYNALLACEKEPDRANALVDSETFEYLVKNKILVDDFEDNNYINKLSFTKRFACSEKGVLSIVLCPTLGCNFACPYCYEHNLSSKSMPEEIQMKVIDFINQYEGKKKGVSLNWHGGEPLVAFDTIKSFYTLFDKYSRLPLERSSMVSNGYLLNSEICNYLNHRKLDYLQITIDGNEATHNKTRILKNGKGTFEQIIKNIDIALELMPNCTIGVRTNIGKKNKEEYSEIYDILSKRWKNKNVNIYYAFILNNSTIPRMEGGSSVELNTREKCNFILSLEKKGVITYKSLFPKIDCGIRTCTDSSAFVIDPEGLLYKCWADVGIKNRSIGTLETGFNNFDIISELVQGSDKFSDSKCLKCKFLPVCDGGCNLYRVNYKKRLIPYDICQYDDEGMKNFLEEYTLKKNSVI